MRNNNYKQTKISGECSRNSKYMLNHCTKSCNICDFTGNLNDLIRMRGDVELLETPYGKAQLPYDDGPYATRIAEIVQETAIYMDTQFYTQSQYAAVHHACKNMDRNCAYWKAIGECEANHIFMWINCSPVCQ
jgi:ShK domain-like